MPSQQIVGPAGNIEAVVENVETSKTNLLGIVCHPHPLYQGTMQNKVATTVMRVFQSLDMVAVKFNFRGVGKSEGTYGHVQGELEDLRAVVAWAKKHYPQHDIILAGFSFGSYIAAKVATEINPTALILLAPPVHHNDFSSLPPIKFPWMVVQGDQDEIVPPAEVFEWIDRLPNKPELIKMPGVGHFFHGHLVSLRQALLTALQAIVHKPE